MLLGDSLTQGASVPYGFAQQLSCKSLHAYDDTVHADIPVVVYNRKLDVINRGLSGYNTTWALPVFKQVHSTLSESHMAVLQYLPT